MASMDKGREVKAQMRESWGSTAEVWVRNERWLEEQVGVLSRWLCDAAGLAPGDQVLDLACGAGQPSLLVAQRVLPGGRVIATDLAPQMVEATRRRHQQAGNPHVEVRVMDAENIEYPDATFDAVTCRFGLMFCPDPIRAASEVRRVLEPGKRFALAVWDEPARNPFFTAIGQVVGKFVPAPPPDPDAPGVFALSSPGALERVLRAAGFADVRVEPMPLTFSYASPEEYYALQSELAAPFKVALATLPPDRVAELREAVLGVGRTHLKDGRVQFGATPLAAVATR